MKIVSPLLKRVLYPYLSATGFLRRRRAGRLNVVTYHGLLPAGYKVVDVDLDGALVAAATFRRQLRLLKSRYNIISPEQFLQHCENEYQLPPRSVLLTCDDGLLSALTDMVPILQEEGVSCLFFVTGACLAKEPRMMWCEELYLMLLTAPDPILMLKLNAVTVRPQSRNEQGRRSLWWKLVEQMSLCDSQSRDELLENVRVQLHVPEDWKRQWTEDSERRRRFLTLNPPQLKQLLGAGMSIGAHSVSHPVLARMPFRLAWHEIDGSRRALENALGVPVWAFAYPFGTLASVCQRELEMVERSGYKCAFMNTGDRFGENVSMFAIPRVHVTAEMQLPEFEAHVSGFHQALRQRCMGRDSVSAAAFGN